MCRSPRSARLPALIFCLFPVACSGGEVPPSPPSSAAEGALHFVEGAAAAGIDFRHVSGAPRAKTYLLESIGAGLAVADFDGDEHLDVYFVNGGSWPFRPDTAVTNRLFLGDGRGKFRRGPAGDPAEDASFGFGAAAADYDRDGDTDLYVCNWGSNRLLRNRGDGTFEDVTEAAGVGDPRWSAAAAFGDVDGDGRLDLYVANYVSFGGPDSLRKLECDWAGIKVLCGPQGLVPEPDRLYRNRGDGTFEDISEASGILAVPPRYALAVMMTDVDLDGDLDIYVANDSVPNSLFVNDGHGRFTEAGLETGLALSSEGVAQAGMGIAAEDFDRDGHRDFVVTNFARDYNTLYRNSGDGTFEDRSAAAGLAAPTHRFLAFGIVAEDFDLDGLFDLFFANGHVYPNVDDHPIDTTYRQKAQIFRGTEAGAFVEVVGAGPDVRREKLGRGAVAGDFDEDGRMDVAVNNLDGPADLLWNRSRPRGRWLGVRVRVRDGTLDRHAVGARVEVTSAGRTQRREVRAGTSFASCSLADLAFSLGGAAAAERVVVVFPDGRRRELGTVEADRVVVVEPAQ